MFSHKSALAAALAVSTVIPAAAFADDGVPGDILVDIRYRTETVEQDGKEDAELGSVRTQIGWRSPEWNGLTFLAEVENMTVINDGGYNSGLNGLSQYAKIGDAEFTELNRFQLGWQVNENFQIVAGRQYLNFDQKRFFGSAGSRQDKKEHDAIMFDYRDGPLRATYVFHESVNGGPGDRGVYAGNNHMFRAQYGFHELLNVTAFAYFIDLDASRANRSNQTFGGWVRGAHSFGDTDVSYEAMLARQVDFGDNPVDYSLFYWASDLKASHGPFNFNLGYDVIEGDGSNRILNPLGTNHGTLGWADVFTGSARQGTDVGLVDLHMQGSFETDVDWGAINGVEVGVRRHDFSAEQGDADLGDEWDAWVAVALPWNLELSWEFADFDGTASPFSPASRTKHWFILSYSR